MDEVGGPVKGRRRAVVVEVLRRASNAISRLCLSLPTLYTSHVTRIIFNLLPPKEKKK